MKYTRIRIAALIALPILLLFLFSSHHDTPIPKAEKTKLPPEVAPAAIHQSTVPTNELAVPETLTSAIEPQPAPNEPSDPAREISEALTVTNSFRQWFEVQTELSDQAVIQEGQTRLKERRSSMVTLIRNAPERAMQQALSYAERERLPEEWRPLIEERFSTIASVNIIPDCSSAAKGHSSHIILERPDLPALQGETWGLLNGYQSKNNLPIEGIALDHWIALADNGVKAVSGLELEAIERHFPIAPSAQNLNPNEASYAALIGGQLHRFASSDDRQAMQALYAEIAALPGPSSATPLIAALNDDHSVTYEYVSQAAYVAASSWTETPKSVLVINTIFPDKTTPVGTQAEWQTVMSEVSDWLSDNSYGKTNLVVTVPPNIFEFPSPSSIYEEGEPYGNSGLLQSDARALALAAGYDSGNYDIIVVAFPYISVPYSGLGSIGGGSQWLNGHRRAGTIAHEFGHNYGLWHASSWDVDDGSIMPDSGAPNDDDSRHEEYGDRFSVMGSSGSLPDGHFSPHGLSKLNWMTSSQIETVSTPGVYRIHRFDHSTADNNPRLTLKLQRGGSQTFWLGYRQNFTSNSYLSNGAYLIWEYSSTKCRLLDMTPDSRTSSDYSDKEDAALALGHTFADPTGLLYITPITKGGTAPNEWLDVQVEFSIAGNEPPTASISLPSGELAARSPITLSANATDPNGDTLTYVWDLGNGQTATGSQVDWSFEAGGIFDISLRVTDGKGGLVEVTEQLQVSDPLTEIEELDLPVTTTFYDGIQHRGLHLSSRSSYSTTSPDGVVWYHSSNSLGFTPKRLATGTDRAVAVGGYYDSESSSWKSKIGVSVDGTHWEAHLPETVGELNSVVYDAGTFVAVGDEGSILTSSDGSSWTSQPLTTVDLYDITKTDNGFIACGQNGTILTSQNGIQATPATWPTLQGIAAKNLQVACVGLGGNYWWSEDGGINWETRSFGLTSFSPNMITQGEDLWVAAYNSYISESSSYELKLAVSSDGLRWGLLPTIPTSAYTRNIRLMDGRLWIYGSVGKVLRSSLLDSSNNAPTLQVNWPAELTVRSDINLAATVYDADGDPVDVVWDLQNHQNYQFGANVTYRPLIGGPVTLTAWASDGQGGHTASSQTYSINDPLLFWSDITPSTLESSSFVTSTSGNGLAMIAGRSTIADASDTDIVDSAAWIKRSLPDSSNWYTYGLAYRAPGFVAVGMKYDFSISGWRSATRFSSDGQTWSAHQFMDGSRLSAVASSSNAYVAVGYEGNIYRSSDGLSWTSVTSGVTTNFYAVAFSETRGLAVGSQLILRSEDSGLNWEDVTDTIGDGFSASKVFEAGGDLYLTRHDRIRQYDPIARTWVDTTVDDSAFGDVQSLILHDSLYLAVTRRYDSGLSQYRRYLLVSEDGLNWGKIEPFWDRDLYALISCDGELVAAGTNRIFANIQGEPGLRISPESITATQESGTSALLANVQLGNTGSTRLTWSVSSNVPWLEVTPSSGEVSVQTPLQINLVNGPAAGTHIGTLTFSAAGVPDQTFTVTLNTFDDDHGNTIESATSYATDTTILGAIQSADDSDWFTITINAPGTLTIWTVGDFYTEGELHGASGLIASNFNFNGYNFQIEETLLPGQYWIKVDGYSSYTGSYELNNTFVPAGPPFTITSMNTINEGSDWALAVDTAVGYSYQVQESGSLVEDWTPVGDWVNATSQETTLTVPIPTPKPAQHFYRISIQAP